MFYTFYINYWIQFAKILLRIFPCISITDICPFHPSVCPDRESNRQPFSVSVGAQPTGPHGPGPPFLFSNGGSIVMSPPIPDTHHLCLLSASLIILARALPSVLIFSKNQIFVLLIFYLMFALLCSAPFLLLILALAGSSFSVS